MISTNISYVSARNRLLGWGILMAIVYAVFLFFFPLFPKIHQPDRVFDIEMLLKDGRKWFAPYYVLGLAVLFLAYWRSLKIVHTLSKEHILMYYILWRWTLRKWDWGINGPLKEHWAYWLTVPWTFGISILIHGFEDERIVKRLTKPCGFDHDPFFFPREEPVLVIRQKPIQRLGTARTRH